MHLGTSGVFFNLFSTSKTLKIQLALLVSPHRWYHLQIGSQKMACGRSGRLSKKPTGCCSLYEIKRHLGVLNVDLYTYRGASPHKNHHFRWMKYGMYLEVSISCRYQCRIYIYRCTVCSFILKCKGRHACGLYGWARSLFAFQISGSSFPFCVLSFSFAFHDSMLFLARLVSMVLVKFLGMI